MSQKPKIRSEAKKAFRELFPDVPDGTIDFISLLKMSITWLYLRNTDDMRIRNAALMLDAKGYVTDTGELEQG
jgi:hypothetical protein